MADETHEGWTNYSTWGVALQIDNDEMDLEMAIGLAEAWGTDVAGLTDALRTSIEDRCDDIEDAINGSHVGEEAENVGVYYQLARAGLARVNWRELAEHYMTKARENATA